MEGELLDKGITLMVAGMGTVFAFLTVLVIATSIMSALLRNAGGGRDGGQRADGEAGEATIAAISAAVAEHRRR